MANSVADVRVLLTYKNFAIQRGLSHIGLGVSSLNTAKVLKRQGITVTVQPVNTATEIASAVKQYNPTHCVIAAPWLAVTEMAWLVRQFTAVEFIINLHSNVGFLAADTNGVALTRQYIDLEQANLNFRISANSRKGTLWIRTAFQCPCLWLPNLYAVDSSAISHRPLWNGGVLNIGAFGATRPLKNLMSAAGAALALTNQLKAQTQFWISGGRPDGGMNVVASIKALLAGLTNITIKEVNWTSWPQFRDIVRTMHVMLQVSYTESFNMVTADGVVEGVASVVSDAIDWPPSWWQASVDETLEIARIARQLLSDPDAASDGLVALEQHTKDGFEDGWCQLLQIYSQYMSPLGNTNLGASLI